MVIRGEKLSVDVSVLEVKVLLDTEIEVLASVTKKKKKNDMHLKVLPGLPSLSVGAMTGGNQNFLGKLSLKASQLSPSPEPPGWPNFPSSPISFTLLSISAGAHT